MAITWELDFYSCPVLDEQQKKLWEVLICESPLDIQARSESLFRYAEFCPSNQVNSGFVKKAIETAIEQAPQPPDKIRFFRRQMTNMITKGCEDAGMPVYGSRRVFALHRWMEERQKNYYPTLPNYQASINPSVVMPFPNPAQLPDALRAEKWQFVSLEASAFADLPDWEIGFGESFPLDLASVTPDMQIPGLIVYSQTRALPIAGWMSGLDAAFLRFETESGGSSYNAPIPRLLLETGASESWILVNRMNPDQQTEAKNFEQAKRLAQNVHFLAVQSDANSEAFAGFWLLQELNLA